MGQVDVPLLYSALDAHRVARGLSWRDVATGTGLDVSLFSRMTHGRQPSLDAYVACCRWLGVSADTFVQDQAKAAGGATLDSE